MLQKPEIFIEYWINNLGRALNKVSDKKLHKYGITSSQAAVLYQLWSKEGLTQKEIQESLNLTAASVSGHVETLLSKELIYRQQDNEDYRCKRLYLTEKGKEFRMCSLETIREIEDALSVGFSEEEKVIFTIWLKKVYNNIKAINT